MAFGMMDGYSLGVLGYGMLILGPIFCILVCAGLVLLIKLSNTYGKAVEEKGLRNLLLKS